ncbi:MAG: dTMP kinase [Bdellovibrionales bacterium]|jgi:dTMP kinase|nr:dTMP kinase [Bdellovibrionales bacterium]MBT3526163.1 dTMP kinase [Bdellovibrionales bacterium]MBT7669238.1 dTMP kinase [Bdellovibrionales bacterium]MBT7766425.1 dTMP kinase [Bdellovibrionales bacterium]
MSITINKSSLFISFEGIEGAGKSSQITHLQTELEVSGYQVTLVREPGGTTFGEKLRSAILDSSTPLHPLAEAYLFASARAQLLDQVILPALAEEKNVVICDRYLDSSIAYQGVARGLGPQTIMDIHSYPPLSTMPHLTIYLQISLPTSLQRMEQRGQKKDYFESEQQDFFARLIDGYQQALKMAPTRVIPIDGEQSEEAVRLQIQSEVWKRLKISKQEVS